MMIHGRSEELAILQQAYRWTALGSTELVLIAGPPGIGKTAFVMQAFKPTVTGRCKFAWGKFDPYGTSHPYAPLVTCFRFLIRQLLTEPEAVLDKWKATIREAVGENGSVITEVIPEARLLLGDSSPIERLPAAKSHHRFEWVFRRFVRAFAKADHPLVLFFDDIQWADRATLALLRSLLIDPDIQHLFILGAHRDQDWNDNELRFEEWLQGEHAGYSIRRLQLEPLEMGHVQTIVSERLQCEHEACFPLAHALYAKTIGNPLYLHQLIQTALDEGIISRAGNAGQWRWNLEALSAFPSIDGQIEYLTGRIKRLPAHAQQLLTVAACLGGSFAGAILSAVSGLSQSRLDVQLFDAVQAGLLAYQDDASVGRVYAFSHDRIHQAAYSLSNRQERSAIHLAAGRYLLEIYRTADREPILFDTVNHLNEALELMSAAERELCCRLNEEAGGKAMQSSAYSEALSYYRRALECLPDDYWSADNAFTFQLHLRAAECEYLCTYYEQAEARLDELIQRAGCWLQRAQVVKLKIDQYSNIGKYAQAIELGCATLREAGMRLSTSPGKAVVQREIRQAKRELDARIQELHALPETDEPAIRLMMEIMVSLVGPTFFSNREVFALLSSRFIRLVMEHGATPIASAIYASYGMVLCTMTRDLASGYRLGNIAMDLADRSGVASVKSKVYAMYHCVISPWMGYKQRDEEQLTDAIHYGLQSGDYVFASYAIGGLINLSYAVHPMQQMLKVMSECLQYVEITKEELIYKNVMIYMHVAEMLQSTDDGDFALTVGRASEAQLLEDVMQDESRAVTLYQIYTYKTQISYLFGRYEEAVRYAELAEPHEGLAVQSPHMPILHFYEAMALSALLSARPDADAQPWRSRLRLRYREFRDWSGMSPACFGYKFMLLQAEQPSGRVPEPTIIELYDRSIQLARDNGDPQYRAVACERAARHHLAKGRERIAQGYMSEAHDAYAEWGVESKSSRLRDEFPEWFSRSVPDHERMPSQHVESGANYARVGQARSRAMEMMKDSLTFSPDMSLHDIRQRLVERIVEITDMQYGCLIRRRSDGLWIEQAMRRGLWSETAPEWMEHSRHVPRSLIQYTSRWGKPVQIGNASQDELFADDPYYAEHPNRSISCLPIYVQSQFVGVLYLELPKAVHPLSEELLSALSMLAAQSLFMMKLSETFGDSADDNEPKPEPIDERLIEPLTDRELEVLSYMSRGMTNKEIAVKLGVTAGTVKVHTHNLFSKLNVSRRMNAVAKAERMKLL